MKCLNCEYPLWRMKPPGPCPECGTEFDPTAHRFKSGAVHFLCPSCGVAYLGNDEDGLPSPRVFACVKCAAPCDASLMAVVPASAGAERAVIEEDVPWTQRKEIGFFRGFFRTLGWSLGKPGEIGRVLPHEGNAGNAAWFCFLIMLLSSFGSFIPLVGFAMFGAAMAGGGGQRGGVAVAGMVAGASILLLLGPVASVFIVYPVWALMAHGVLSLGATPRRGMSGTMRCCWYASGPTVVSAVPCFGIYLTPVSMVWSAISAALMFKSAHGVSTLRAFIAAFLTPVVALAAIGVLIWATMWGTFGPRGVLSGSVTPAGPSDLSSALLDAKTADGSLPDHVLLGANVDQISAWSLDASGSGELELEDGSIVEDLGELTESEREQLIAASGAEPFYLLGDVIFAHRGVDMDTADPELWLAFRDPRVGVAGEGDGDPAFVYVDVHLADGQEGQAYGPWAKLVEKQNELRQAAGLPLIPEDWDELPARPGASSTPDANPDEVGAEVP